MCKHARAQNKAIAPCVQNACIGVQSLVCSTKTFLDAELYTKANSTGTNCRHNNQNSTNDNDPSYFQDIKLETEKKLLNMVTGKCSPSSTVGSSKSLCAASGFNDIFLQIVSFF